MQAGTPAAAVTGLKRPSWLLRQLLRRSHRRTGRAHANALPLQGGTPAAAAADVAPDAAEVDPEAELDPEPAPDEPSEEELLTQLGLQLEQRIEQLQTAEGVVPPAVAQRWAAEERRRSRERWQPQRPHSAAGAHLYML